MPRLDLAPPGPSPNHQHALLKGSGLARLLRSRFPHRFLTRDEPARSGQDPASNPFDWRTPPGCPENAWAARACPLLALPLRCPLSSFPGTLPAAPCTGRSPRAADARRATGSMKAPTCHTRRDGERRCFFLKGGNSGETSKPAVLYLALPAFRLELRYSIGKLRPCPCAIAHGSWFIPSFGETVLTCF